MATLNEQSRDVKKSYNWYVKHPDAFKELMANRRRHTYTHRTFEPPKAPPKQEEDKPVVEHKPLSETQGGGNVGRSLGGGVVM